MPNKWCRACGAENDASSSFCQSCGRSLDNNNDIQTASNSKDKVSSQNTGQPAYGFQNQPSQAPNQFQTKKKLRPQNSAALGFSAYISVVVIIIGIILFLFGQHQVDEYSGYFWYEPYENRAQLGSFLRAIGGIGCIGGIVGVVRYYLKKK